MAKVSLPSGLVAGVSFKNMHRINIPTHSWHFDIYPSKGSRSNWDALRYGGLDIAMNMQQTNINAQFWKNDIPPIHGDAAFDLDLMQHLRAAGLQVPARIWLPSALDV